MDAGQHGHDVSPPDESAGAAENARGNVAPTDGVDPCAEACPNCWSPATCMSRAVDVRRQG
jgi:hypothetical protein